MKKFIAVFLVLYFIINPVATAAEIKTYSQGFYTMEDLKLSENTIYKVQNHEPYVQGLLIVLDSNARVQQYIRIPSNSTVNTLVPLEKDYKFIIYNNVNLTFFK